MKDRSRFFNFRKLVILIIFVMVISYSTGVITFSSSHYVIIGGLVGGIFGPLGAGMGIILGSTYDSVKDVDAIFITIAAAIAGGIIGSQRGGSCNLYQAPAGGDNCDKCNNILNGCTEYQCKALGQSCEYLSEEQKCVAVESGDTTPPIIVGCEARDIETTRSYGVSSGRDSCIFTDKIPEFSSVAIRIKTDEFARCRFALEAGVDFSDTSKNELFSDGIYDLDHFTAITIADVDEDQVTACEKGDLCSLYVRCQDVAGNVMLSDYVIRFGIEPGPDIQPPTIQNKIVPSGSGVPVGTTEIDFSMRVSDLTFNGVNCRWNKDRDIKYADMINEFSCDGQFKYDLGGYLCSTTLTGLQDEVDNTYYFRCRDNAETPNANDEGFKFVLKGSKELEIVDAGPSDIIFTKKITLTVRTLEGLEDGKAVCSYSDVSFDDTGNRFEQTDSNVHTQILELVPGGYTYYVNCVDDAGNQARDTINFEVQFPPLVIDTASPDDTTLKDSDIKIGVITEGGISGDGDATCKFGEGINDVSYRSFNGKEIKETFTVHEQQLSLENSDYIYSIKCEDDVGTTAETVIRFTVDDPFLSTSYPEILQFYTSGQRLNVVFSEEAKCEYGDGVFAFGEGKEMTPSTFSTTKQALLGLDVYKIKCINEFDRESPMYTVYV